MRPRLGLGYSENSYKLGLARGRTLTTQAVWRRGVMDADMIIFLPDSWPVSADTTVDNVAGFLRYGRDVFSSLSSSPSRAQKQTP
jgi:DnaJ family protein C protein 11